MSHWSLDDVPWDRFDPALVDADLLRVVKAAAMVEYNAPDYIRYLGNVFADDRRTQAEIEHWGVEEIQHGAALGRWARLADPDFDFDGAFRRFTDGYKLQTEVTQSIRGTRTGELVARCVVEIGTSSFYSALAESAQEPVLKFICRKIASDEFRHYKLFYEGMQRYLPRERLGLWKRLGVGVGRIAEAADDELAYAYDAATGDTEPYDRQRCNRAYAARAYPLYRRHHVQNGITMAFRAVGLKPHGPLNRLAANLAWRAMQRRVKQYGATSGAR